VSRHGQYTPLWESEVDPDWRADNVFPCLFNAPSFPYVPEQGKSKSCKGAAIPPSPTYPIRRVQRSIRNKFLSPFSFSSFENPRSFSIGLSFFAATVRTFSAPRTCRSAPLWPFCTSSSFSPAYLFLIIICSGGKGRKKDMMEGASCQEDAPLLNMLAGYLPVIFLTSSVYSSFCFARTFS
jgi:hypothetical protein